MNSYSFYVVGIGSSAGGHDPLMTIIRDLSPDINAAVIVTQHMPADAPSKLDKLLQKLTTLKVVAVETIEYIEPGNIYVMAAGKQLTLQNRLLSAKDRDSADKRNRTIDECFLSIARDAGDKAVGIVLSGAGYDGLEGAQAIEDKHGFVIAQDPITAEFPLMPRSLICNDHPDYVLQPHDISSKLQDRVGLK